MVEEGSLPLSGSVSRGDERPEKPRLIYSDIIGPPPFVYDPEDLIAAYDPFPDKLGPRIRIIDEDTIIKFGRDVRLAEAEALHLVSARTNIAVPKVKAAYTLHEDCYIVMSYEDGEPLDQYWDTASQSQRAQVVSQMKDYIAQLRTVQSEFIGGVNHASCKDAVFMQHWNDVQHQYGPYESEETFNNGIIQAMSDRFPPGMGLPKSNQELAEDIGSLRGHKIVLTHADLHAGNILVRGDGTVVLLDWGVSGFYPEYWEYCRATFMPRNSDWEGAINQFVPAYEAEKQILKRLFNVMMN
ncbi:hypothetical protein MBLNU459_g5570t1 [Dothideomycetes sp. NU459]